MKKANDTRATQFANLKHKIARFLASIAHQKVEIDACDLYLIDQMQYLYIDKIINDADALQMSEFDIIRI